MNIGLAFAYALIGLIFYQAAYYMCYGITLVWDLGHETKYLRIAAWILTIGIFISSFTEKWSKAGSLKGAFNPDWK